ncbi:MAG: hypothetical protein ACRD5G_01280 [Candidatus Acidiferrales bacterium]
MMTKVGRAGSGSDAGYERARAVARVLWQYEQVCRRAGRPVSAMLEEAERSQREGKVYGALERDVALIVDMERLLGALTRFQRAVLALVGLRGLGEVVAAKRLHSNQAAVGRAYWRAVDALYWLLVGAKYLQPLAGGSDGEDQAEEAGAESSVAEVAAGRAGAGGERAGAGGV